MRCPPDRPPIVAGWPLAVGTGVGALLVVWAHVAFGWHTQAVVAAPVLLVGGMLGVLTLREGARRVGASVRSVIGVEIGSLIVVIILLWAALLSFVAQLGRRIDFLLSAGGIAETSSFVSGPLGTIVGPILLFGLVLFLAVPYLGGLVASVSGLRDAVACGERLRLVLPRARADSDPIRRTTGFICGGVRGSRVRARAVWFGLTTYPAPFVAEELGSSTLPSDSTRPSRSSASSSRGNGPELAWAERREVMYTAAWGLGVGSLGTLMTPIKHSQLSVSESVYEAAQFIREYSEERGWEYPENYVFSKWGRNRVYNRFVNGESGSYGVGRRNFEEFLASSDGEE